jgi:hypothetical protein
MFDTLTDRIRQDDQLEVASRERLLRWTLVAVLSFSLFSALFFAVKVLE